MEDEDGRCKVSCSDPWDNETTAERAEIQRLADEAIVRLQLSKPDNVNNPGHYGGADNPHEHWKCAQAWGLVDTPKIGAWLYNASKYICRAGKKDGASPIEDLRKAIWYLDRAVKRLEEDK